jgi:hypothetical protein
MHYGLTFVRVLEYLVDRRGRRVQNTWWIGRGSRVQILVIREILGR